MFVYLYSLYLILMSIYKPAFSLGLLIFLLYIIPGSFVSIVYGQSPVFIPAPENAVLLGNLSGQAEKLYKTELAKLPSKNRKDLEEIYKSRWDYIKSVFEKKEIYTSTNAQEYLDALVDEIVKANPALQQQTFHCYFSRSGVPNASYIGEGIILFNMGLFRQLNNESEAIFVLCHEISHYFLRHAENSIQEHVNTLNAKEMQDALRKIKASEYGKREQLDKLLKGYTFDSRRHTRDHEAQADSMAMEFIRNTGFDKTSALSLLTLLDDIDKDTINVATCLQELFNAEDYPFQKKWIAKQHGLLGGHTKLEEDKALEDSLKTHPDCKKRIKLLEPVVALYQSGSTAKNVVSKEKFDSLKHIFQYEVIEYAYQNDNYSLSLYYTLKSLQQQGEDVYLVTQVGKMLNSCYTAQKEHILGKKVGLPSPGRSDGYNLLLQFIQNLYQEDYVGISYHYLLRYQARFDTYPAFSKELNRSLQAFRQ